MHLPDVDAILSGFWRYEDAEAIKKHREVRSCNMQFPCFVRGRFVCCGVRDDQHLLNASSAHTMGYERAAWIWLTYCIWDASKYRWEVHIYRGMSA